MTIRVCDRCGTRINDGDKLRKISYNFDKNECDCLELCNDCMNSFRKWLKSEVSSLKNVLTVDISEGTEKPSNPCLKCDSSVRQSCCGCPEYYDWMAIIYPPEQTEQK